MNTIDNILNNHRLTISEKFKILEPLYHERLDYEFIHSTTYSDIIISDRGFASYDFIFKYEHVEAIIANILKDKELSLLDKYRLLRDRKRKDLISYICKYLDKEYNYKNDIYNDVADIIIKKYYT